MSMFSYCKLILAYSLFHVVVDTDATAQKVLEIMIKEKRGRVTFMPLNRLHPRVPPTPNAQDAIPLMDKLQFNQMHVKAIQQVFGKTCVCRDLTIAAAYVKSHGINTITLDGDKVDRKGALTGGYHDLRRSRLEAINNLTNWKAKYTADKQRLEEVTATIQQLEQEITRTMGKIQVESNKLNQVKNTRETSAEESLALNKERERLVGRIEKLEGDVLELENELSSLNAKVEGYRTELTTPLATGLSAAEEEQIEELGREVEQRRRQLVDLGKNKNEASYLILETT